MKHSERGGLYRSGRPRGLLLSLLALSVTIALAATLISDQPFRHESLFSLSNLVGPTTLSLLQQKDLLVCTTAMGTPVQPICFHAARMPVPSLVIACGVRLFGDFFLRVALFKALLFLLPINGSMWLVWRSLPPSRSRQTLVTLALLVPFAMTPFLANIVNLQVEEGYVYSLLALCTAIVFFAPPEMLEQTAAVVLFSASLDLLYLSKSSMLLTSAVLGTAFFTRLRSVGLRALLVLVIAAGPVGWAVYVHHASGRYTLGTSLDGMNLHKGNAAGFLDHYPPPAGSSLDRYDADLNAGHIFPDEWSFDDFHRHAALSSMREHPIETLKGDVLKGSVLLISVRKYGSSESHGLRLAFETAGLLVFRLLFWGSVGWAAFLALKTDGKLRDEMRPVALTYLALVAACTLPYIVGFAYTRHASVLIYPVCLLCCRALCVRGS